MIQLRNGMWACQVPMKFGEPEIFDIDGKKYLNGLSSTGEMYAAREPLPEGNWEFMFCSLLATDEDTVKVVEIFAANYKTYRNYNWPAEPENFHWRPTESFYSLLRSKNLNPDFNFAILKKLDTTLL